MAEGPYRLEPKAQGGISSYQPSLREDAAYFLSKVWFGDDREGVAKAKRFLDVTGVGAVPIIANEFTRAIRQNPGRPEEAALGAMAGLIPALRGVHISKHDFPKFSMKKVGAGLGAQIEGKGLYFSPPSSPATPWYADLMTDLSIRDKSTGKISTKDDEWGGDPDQSVRARVYALLDEYLGKKVDSDRLNDLSDMATVGLFNPLTGPEMLNNTGIEGRAKELVNKYFEPIDVKKPFKYETNLNVGDPVDLPWLGVPLKSQPIKHQPALEKLASRTYPPEKMVVNREQWNKADPNKGMNVSLIWPEMNTGQGFFAQNPAEAEKNIKQTLELNELKRRSNPLDLINKYFGEHVPDIMTAHDIPAIQYPEYERVAKADRAKGKYVNTVMFNDKLIDIVRKSKMGLAGVGIGAYLMGQGGDEAKAEPAQPKRRRNRGER